MTTKTFYILGYTKFGDEALEINDVLGINGIASHDTAEAALANAVENNETQSVRAIKVTVEFADEVSVA
jgi:hypothetical protein